MQPDVRDQMKRKKRIMMASAAGLFILLAVVTGVKLLGQKNRTEPEFVFLYAENQPEGYPTSMGAQYFAEQVEARTNGKIKILVKTGGELGVEKDVIDQLTYGGIDFARISLSQLAEKIPEMNILQLPYIYQDSDHMWRVLDGELGNYFMNLTEGYDLVGLSWYDAGARNFYCKKSAITCLDDIKGMKIRVQESQLMADMVEAMGGIPVKMEYEDVYSGLERGIVDGAENNWSSYVFMNHNEVARFFTLDEHTRVPELQLCSANTFRLLSEEEQEIIIQCARESAVYERELWREQELACRKEAVANGTIVVELTPTQKAEFRKAMQSVYEKYSGSEMDLIQKVIKCNE